MSVLDRYKSEPFLAQKAEFDAVAELARLWRIQPAIVDDDYPSWRAQYERQIKLLMRALVRNRG